MDGLRCESRTEPRGGSTGLGYDLARARSSYVARNPRSRTAFDVACASMPGGNTRSVLYYFPFPLTMVAGRGCYLWDADGHQYVDFLGDYTAGLFGHSNPEIQDALTAALASGISRGGHSELESLLATRICRRFPSIELVRFTNSGTEANLLAIGAARAVTGKGRVLVFDGAYHGSVLSFLDGPSPLNIPVDFVVGRYNDPEGTLRALDGTERDLAAILVEPMMGAAGCIPARREFLEFLKEESRRRQALLIFDEVMTSRLAFGGLQETHRVVPDLTTLGKYLGGGITFGAFGGTGDVMRRFDLREAGALAHSGTFNNNVLSLAAGVAGMTLFTREACDELNGKGERLRHRLAARARREGVTFCATGCGSMLALHPVGGPVNEPFCLDEDARIRRELLFLALLADGFWVGPKGFVSLTLPIVEAHCDELVEAVGRVFERCGGETLEGRSELRDARDLRVGRDHASE